MEPSQAEVRRTMLEAGGYWRPLAAVARLLEELGELVELLVRAGPGAGALASELADLWIITTALADQFRIDVPEPQGAPPSTTVAPSSAGLVMTAGRIARVVNYYDGPKTPRSRGDLPSLTEAIAGFHGELERLCAALEVDLRAAVGAKLLVIHGRDMKRFAREDSDPATAAALGLLPQALRIRRLWGAPAAGPDAVAAVASLVPSLTAFTKAARAEGLEGYVLPAPAMEGSAELGEWLESFARALADADPARTAASPPVAGELHFNGLALNIEIVPAEAGEEDDGPARALIILVPGEPPASRG